MTLVDSFKRGEQAIGSVEVGPLCSSAHNVWRVPTTAPKTPYVIATFFDTLFQAEWDSTDRVKFHQEPKAQHEDEEPLPL